MKNRATVQPVDVTLISASRLQPYSLFQLNSSLHHINFALSFLGVLMHHTNFAVAPDQFRFCTVYQFRFLRDLHLVLWATLDLFARIFCSPNFSFLCAQRRTSAQFLVWPDKKFSGGAVGHRGECKSSICLCQRARKVSYEFVHCGARKTDVGWEDQGLGRQIFDRTEIDMVQERI